LKEEKRTKGMLPTLFLKKGETTTCRSTRASDRVSGTTPFFQANGIRAFLRTHLVLSSENTPLFKQESSLFPLYDSDEKSVFSQYLKFTKRQNIPPSGKVTFGRHLNIFLDSHFGQFGITERKELKLVDNGKVLKCFTLLSP
jgi:hypothetical protein